MFVYRIENKEGEGPYYRTDSSRWCFDPHTAETGRPGPYDDEGLSEYWTDMRLKISKTYQFGFASLHQLCAWFTDAELKRLRSLGFEVVKYEMDQIEALVIGSKQAMFRLKERR